MQAIPDREEVQMGSVARLCLALWAEGVLGAAEGQRVAGGSFGRQHGGSSPPQGPGRAGLEASSCHLRGC